MVGLVAARLKERYGRPAFAIALEPGGIGTGSGRSIAGVDLGQAVRRAVREGLLLKGGGHAMAAGITLKKDALAAFRAFLEDALAASVEAARRESGLAIDGAVSAGGVNLALVEMLARAGPYGAGNPEPTLALPAHTLAYADIVGENHIRARFKSGDGKIVNAIAFRAVGTAARPGAARQSRPADARGRSSCDRPLARRGARADAAHRCGDELVFSRGANVCGRFFFIFFFLKNFFFLSFFFFFFFFFGFSGVFRKGTVI